MQNGLNYKIILFLLLSTLLTARSTIIHSLAVVNMNMDYKEYDKEGKILDSEKSEYLDMNGFYYDTGYKINKRGSYDELMLSVLYLGGITVYKGSLLNENYGSFVDINQQRIIDAQFTYSKAYLLGNSVAIRGGIGIGYRYWKRILSKSQTEIYKWSSVRPNLGLIFNLGNSFLLQTSVEYQYGMDAVMLDVEEKSEFELGSANIIQGDISLRMPIANTVDISMQYTYQLQKIEASKVVNGYYEPDSTAKNQYIKIGVIVRY
jgi:hypothetical protein